MIHAYDKVYLEKARTALGRMLDFAVYDLKYEIEDFWGLFLVSGIAKRFGEGDFQLLVGMSGVELAYKVLECSGIENERIKPMYAETEAKNTGQDGHWLIINGKQVCPLRRLTYTCQSKRY